MPRSIELSEIQVVSVSNSEIDKIKSTFDYSTMPSNSKEIIIEATDDNIEELTSIISEELETGYIILYVK
ncbi:hypothetical protein [Photobacterium damselae]|uniref:hypothetical protein n=1 Tax=Photobacterium damselae TaxID=38293 RepID=UPI004067D99C